MATYIQGQQDYITQVQPTAPNLQFDAQILGLKQSKYDANHKKVSDLYGSLLNSDMTRTENNLARNEFFKIINGDIKKMGSFDFSLDSNVTAAASIFESIYTNQNIVKDMVWTKNYNNEVTRMDGFKNCLDEEKCGGTYWEQGEKYMNYKRKEFETASTGEALNTENVRFIPNKSVMKEAIKLAKAADLNVTIDKKNGDYIVRTKNGELITSPLTTLFKETIGSDPAFADKFLAEAYVKRNDWVYNKVAMGEFSTPQEGQMAYLNKIDRDNREQLSSQAKALNQDLIVLNQSVAYYKNRYETGQFKDGSDEFLKYENLLQLQQNAQAAANYTQNLRQVNAANNKNAAMEVLLNNSDQQTAYIDLNKELQSAVNTLAFSDYESTMTADEFAVLNTKYEHDRGLARQKHAFTISEDNNKHENAKKLEQEKSRLKEKEEKKTKKDTSLERANTIAQAQLALDAFKSDIEGKVAAEYRRKYPTEEMPSPQLQIDDTEKGKKVKDIRAEIKSKQTKLEAAVNMAKYKDDKMPDYPLSISKQELELISEESDEYETEALKYMKLTVDEIVNNYTSGGKKISEGEAATLVNESFANKDGLQSITILKDLTNQGKIKKKQ
jgi:hypothetical protein